MNKSILVTGATDGIGLHIATSFAQKGWQVIGTCHKIANYPKKFPFELYQCDQSKISEIESFAGKINEKKFNAGILNAGVAAFSLLQNIREEEYDYVMNTNLKGTLFFLQKIVHQIETNGAIIVIGSVSPKISLRGSSVYAASKVALKAVVKVLATELSERNIRINMVSPGVIDTNMYNKFQPIPDKVEKLKQSLIAQTKLKRLGTVHEVGDLVDFLVSERSTYITGQEFIIDGGLTIGFE